MPGLFRHRPGAALPELPGHREGDMNEDQMHEILDDLREALGSGDAGEPHDPHTELVVSREWATSLLNAAGARPTTTLRTPDPVARFVTRVCGAALMIAGTSYALLWLLDAAARIGT
jgi:hypothetical protein